MFVILWKSLSHKYSNLQEVERMCAGSQALASSSQTALYCYEQQTLKEHSMQFSMDFKNKISGGKSHKHK